MKRFHSIGLSQCLSNVAQILLFITANLLYLAFIRVENRSFLYILSLIVSFLPLLMLR